MKLKSLFVATLSLTGILFNVQAEGTADNGQPAQGTFQKQGMPNGRGMMGRNMPKFSDCDLNGDGKILEQEFYDARAKRISQRAQQGYQMRNLANAPSFADMDTNSDGAISPEEFRVHQAQHRQQRQRP